MAEEDLYIVLGIKGGGPQVPQQELRKAYRSQALIWHPDKQAGKEPTLVTLAALEFEKIQKAYATLGDEKARKNYDELRHLRQSRLEQLLRQTRLEREQELSTELQRAEKRCQERHEDIWNLVTQDRERRERTPKAEKSRKRRADSKFLTKREEELNANLKMAEKNRQELWNGLRNLIFM